jgi:16S rRNA (guanine966-N2)-methyltransferase
VQNKARGHIRIIGGKWRGRQVNVVSHGNLRPTPDFVRETLFNWLTGRITDARCLDLFAGTGVLGFEALSRGAGSVTFVDHHAPVVKEIKSTAIKLDALGQCEIVLSDSIRWLKHQKEMPFDIIFLDPPYNSFFLYNALDILYENKLVHANTLLYLELPAELNESKLPAHWQLIKQKSKGEVFFHLVEINAL